MSGQVLIVDDNDINRLLVSRLLSKGGWQVAEAEHGSAALSWLSANRADLVLLDISMPDISGEDVCQRIRAQGLGGAGMRIVAYTAHAMPEERERFLSNGFDAILIKPVSRQSLAGLLTELGYGQGTTA